MSKEIGKVRGKARNMLGVRSEVKKGQFAGDGIFHDTVDSMDDEDSYNDYSQYVKLPIDFMKTKQVEKLSGDVKKFNISDLPEEERKKYERSGN